MLPALDTIYDPTPDRVRFVTNGWKWEPKAKPPTRDEHGTLHFEDFPDFTPNKTPKEIIHEGAFGGGYFWPFRSRKLSLDLGGSHESEGSWCELPSEWLVGLDIGRYLTGEGNDGYAELVNKYKVSCDQSVEEWLAAGWYQWYSRFFQGRRIPDDRRQINKWLKRAGPNGFWRRMLLKSLLRNRYKHGETRKADLYLQQMCHHWAYELRKGDISAFPHDDPKEPYYQAIPHRRRSFEESQDQRSRAWEASRSLATASLSRGVEVLRSTSLTIANQQINIQGGPCHGLGQLG
ncbi:hypothetical protein BKA65DRAFT_71027 [Rhexocercosporidium sp. MPI-PUGE-AT-0058]|nr:hypothetical protein BKA65DRAFT_71027 [Rhexocercosporidium sp. MPI-PUGE-AT-0058]